MPLTPVSELGGTSPGSPAGFLGLSRLGKCPSLLAFSSSPRGPLPPASSDLPGLPPMSPGPLQLGAGLGVQGTGLGAQQPPLA